MIGYQNVSKGTRRIDKFEKFGQIHEDLLAKLAAALEIDDHTVARLIEEDRQWTEPGDINVPYLRFGRRRDQFQSGAWHPKRSDRTATDRTRRGRH